MNSGQQHGRRTECSPFEMSHRGPFLRARTYVRGVTVTAVLFALVAGCGGTAAKRYTIDHAGVTTTVDLNPSKKADAIAITEALRTSLRQPALHYITVREELGRTGKPFPISKVRIVTAAGEVKLEDLFFVLNRWGKLNLTNAERFEYNAANDANTNASDPTVAIITFTTTHSVDKVQAVYVTPEHEAEVRAT